MLIVVTDADNLDVDDRERTLQKELLALEFEEVRADEPVIILIPKWQVETWIRCLLGQQMDENDRDSDRPPVTREQTISAASNLFDWARPNARVGGTCVASLRVALPRWNKIG